MLKLKTELLILLNNVDIEERKKFIKSLKNELKRTRKKEKRKYNFHDIIDAETSVKFLELDLMNFKKRMKEEELKSYSFLVNEEEAKKAGWYSKKNDPIQLMKWCESAYSDINHELWSCELEKEILVASLTEPLKQ